MEMIVFSRSCYHFLYSTEGYLFALLVTILMIYDEMSLQRSLTFGFWLSYYLGLFSRSLCWDNGSCPNRVVIDPAFRSMHSHLMAKFAFYLVKIWFFEKDLESPLIFVLFFLRENKIRKKTLRVCLVRRNGEWK